MSDSSRSFYRGITPVTARSSMAPADADAAAASLYGGSVSHRKLRLRVVTRHPLPELHFLAPFDPSDANCFAKLQGFIHAHLVSRAKRAGQTEVLGADVGPERLRLQMDDFEVPFDDPEILRDGDGIEVHLDLPAAGMDSRQDGGSEAEAAAAVIGEMEDDDEDDVEAHIQDVEEREAILEASRVAALLRAGIHNMADIDDDVDIPAHHRALDDLPRMPSFQPTQAPKLSKASTSLALPAPPLPPLPTPFAQGPAAAMAAFEAKRKQMQTPSQPKPSAPMHLPLSTRSSRKRARSSSSSSSSSSSESSSDSTPSDNSSSGSGSVSDSDSGSASSSSSDTDTDTDSSSSSSAPSEHRTQSDRQRRASTSSPTPPGKGTNRTKRRNQMRRKKLALLREAENIVEFQRAQERAVRRERGEDVDSDVTPLRIKGSAAASLSGSAGSGSGSVGAVSTIESFAQDIEHVVDSKQQEEPVAAAHTQVQPTLQPRLEDMQDGQAPYGGHVPAGMTIRHVDCQTYYDEVSAMFEAQASEDHGSGSKRQRGPKGKAKAQQAHDESPARDDVFYLDYGEPDAAAAPERKKVKLEPADDVSAHHSHAAPRSTHTRPSAPSHTWTRIQTSFTPGTLTTLTTAPAHFSTLAPATALLWTALALDPTTRTPAVMRFVGVVTDAQPHQVRVQAIGPLTAHAPWSDYEVHCQTWTSETRPDDLSVV